MVLRRVQLRPDGTTRLSTLLAATGDFSRKQTRRGKATLDGVVTDLDTRIKPSLEPVELRFKGGRYRIQADQAMVLALHKPEGLVCSHEEENPRAAQIAGGTVFDLIPAWLAIEGLEPIGRLDKETSGLLLFTEHGTLSQRLRHPSRAVERRYIATLARPLEASTIAQALQDGVALKDGSVVKPTRLAPAGDELHYSVTITEGRYHEVRRLFAALGSHVEALHRDGYGAVTLQAQTAPAALEGETIHLLREVQEDGTLLVSHPVMRLDGEARAHLLRLAGAEEVAPFVQIIGLDADAEELESDTDGDAGQGSAQANATTHTRAQSDKLSHAKLRDFDEF